MKVDKKYLKEIIRQILSKIEKDETILVDAVNKLDVIYRLYKENRVFRNVLINPKLSFEEKLRMLEKVKDVLNLNSVIYEALVKVVKDRKVDILKDIGPAFKFEVEKFFATLEGEILTAHPIDNELLSKIKNVVESKLGKKIEFTVKEDPNLIAGAVIRAGSYVIDTSVKTYLKKLEQELSRF